MEEIELLKARVAELEALLKNTIENFNVRIAEAEAAIATKNGK